MKQGAHKTGPNSQDGRWVWEAERWGMRKEPRAYRQPAPAAFRAGQVHWRRKLCGETDRWLLLASIVCNLKAKCNRAFTARQAPQGPEGPA